jgi:hypothetical protein
VTELVHGEGNQDPLGQPPVGATGAGPGPAGDGGNHLVRGRLVAAMDPERAAPRHADQDSPIRVEDHRHRSWQAMGAKPDGEELLDHAGFIRP